MNRQQLQDFLYRQHTINTEHFGVIANIGRKIESGEIQIPNQPKIKKWEDPYKNVRIAWLVDLFRNGWLTR
jgi:hypothetical protein